MAVRKSISSGHYILSTIHADKASSIPNRMYSLLETNQDIDQFLKSIYRYIQLGVYIRGYQDKVTKHFVREIAEVTEFYVTENNEAKYNTIYRKTTTGNVYRNKPSKYLIDYLDGQGVNLPENIIKVEENNKETNNNQFMGPLKQNTVSSIQNSNTVNQNKTVLNRFMSPTNSLQNSNTVNNNSIKQNNTTINNPFMNSNTVDKTPIVNPFENNGSL